MSVPPRSAWSGKCPAGLQAVELSIPNWKLRPTPTTLWVEPEHEAPLREFVSAWTRFARMSGVMQLVCVSAIFLGVALRAVGISGLALVGSGVTVIAFPFATPETVRLIGAQQAKRVARLAGVMIVLVGLVILVFWRTHGAA